MVQRHESVKTSKYIFSVLTVVLISVVSWFASTVAVFLTTGFIDIQPKWADNTYIVNFPVYIFAVLAVILSLFRVDIMKSADKRESRRICEQEKRHE